MAAIYDMTDGSAISQGLQGCHACDQAIQIARRTAAERGETVHLEDDDGDWAVAPDGSCAELTLDLSGVGSEDG